MAKALLIKARSKEENKNPNTIRREGYIPATVYGHGFSSESVQVNAKDFSKVPYKAYSHINELDVEGKEKFPVLIRNVQVDPIRDHVLNIEFYKIKSDEKIKVKVALNYIGHSSAVTKGGILIITFNEVEIQCLPKDIPDVIDVNLDTIEEIGQAIHPKDLKVSEAIQILTTPNEVLAKVEIAKTHEVEDKAPATDTATATATPTAGTEATPAAATKETAPKTAAGGKTAEAKPAKK